jgi:hypothetical protein
MGGATHLRILMNVQHLSLCKIRGFLDLHPSKLVNVVGNLDNAVSLGFLPGLSFHTCTCRSYFKYVTTVVVIGPAIAGHAEPATVHGEC